MHAPSPHPEANLREFLDRLAALSAEYGIVIETDQPCLYILGKSRGGRPGKRTFLADGLGFDDSAPAPRYYCCPH